MKHIAIFVLLSTLVACQTPRPAARETASTTRIALEVQDSSSLAVGVKDDLVGNFRDSLLKTKAGIPVEDASQADLVVRFHITSGNFTAATGWSWQLIDPSSGAIIASETDTSSMGKSGESLAHQVVAKIMKVDTTPYSKDKGKAVLAQQEPLTPVGAPSSATEGNNAWAIVIGVEKYRESLPEATGAEADARRFSEFAKTTLNVPESNIKLLLGERASRADLTGVLMEWLPRNAVQPGGRVYVFFSGHGAPDVESGSSYLVPYDANPTYIKSGGLSVASLQKQLSALPDQEVYVFLDACFSGLGERSVLPKGTRPVVPVKKIEAHGKVVTFTASGATETTGADSSGKHGLFSYHLFAALAGGADANSDRNLSTAEIAEYLNRTVPSEARRQNREQTPTATNTGNALLIQGLQ